MISEDYFAGFFDGEGCINITYSGKNRQTRLRLMLTNTDHAFLENIQSQYGGRLVRREQKNHANWKPFCQIVWVGKEAADLLRRIGSRLILKRPQVELALEFASFMGRPAWLRCECEIRLHSDGRNRVIKRRSQDTLAKELDFKGRLHSLNKKGVDAPIQ